MSSKLLLRDAVAAVARVLGISSPSNRLRGRLLVLTFHRVLPGPLRDRYPYPGLVVTPEELRWVLQRCLSFARFGVLSDCIDSSDESAGGGVWCAVTFDDAQWDNFHYAAPVLSDLNVRGTFYVPTAAVSTGALLWHDVAGFAWERLARDPQFRNAAREYGSVSHATTALELVEQMKRLPPAIRADILSNTKDSATTEVPDWARMMTWGEIRQMADAGHEIGSHSVSHAILTQLSEEQIQKELADSKSEIESRAGLCVRSLCYPNGDHDPAVVRVARNVGYKNAVTTRWGSNLAGADPFTLRRCDMNIAHVRDRRGGLDGSLLDFRLSGLSPGLPR